MNQNFIKENSRCGSEVCFATAAEDCCQDCPIAPWNRVEEEEGEE